MTDPTHKRLSTEDGLQIVIWLVSIVTVANLGLTIVSRVAVWFIEKLATT